MRIFGRRDEPGLPTGDPVATYAAVLDGEHLWWHVDGHDQLLLRPVGDDAVAGPGEVDVTGDRFSLTGLTAHAYDVLAGGRPVRAPDLPDRSPARTPLTSDGLARYDVAPADGHLRIVRQTLTPTARLDAVGLRGGRIQLRVAVPPPVGAEVRLLLLDEQDEVLQDLPLTGPEDRLEGSLGAADLPAGHVGVLRIAVGTAADWLRIRRQDTGLADPNHAVLLPELPAILDDRREDRVRARLRWSPESLLALRVVAVETEESG